jgi:hypothetical protein
MTKLKILIFQLLIGTCIYGQEDKAIDFDYNTFALRDSIGTSLTITQIINKVNTVCSTDTQKLCLVAGWFFENIDFDLDKFNTGGQIGDYESVFINRKGTCGDYASLFAEFCNRLKIKNEIIEGYVPEYNSKNKVYYETNHAWNVVKLGENWFHCDLLGFSGYLKKDKSGGFQFIKQVNTSDFLIRDSYFLSKHIPADPIWQLSNYPIPLDSLLEHGYKAKIDSTQKWFDYQKGILDYTESIGIEKRLKYADCVYEYNINNSNVIVISYFNAAVDLVNNWDNNKARLIQAKKYLAKAKKYAPNAKNGAEVLEGEIDNALEMINKYVP